MLRRLARSLFVCAVVATAGIADAQEPAIVVGGVVSQTGANAEAATAYRRGLELWQQQVNARGGMLNRRVSLRLLDDQSDAARTGPLYGQLLREERPDLLIGPYGSAASAVAAAVAERARRVMLNASGAARAVHKAGHLHVFQVPTPYSAYGASVLDIARTLGQSRLFVLARGDITSREAGQGLVERARAAGLATPDVEPVTTGQTDFTAVIARARAVQPDAWVAFVSAREAVELVRAFRKLDYAPRMLVVQGATDPAFVTALGQDAEFAIGMTLYDPGWRTSGNAEFVAAYRARWGNAPNLDAAHAYSAGIVLEEAVRRAGTLETAALRARLAELSMQTPLGEFKADPRTGEQLGARLALVQVQAGRLQTVWPELLANVPARPYPQWRDRQLIR